MKRDRSPAISTGNRFSLNRRRLFQLGASGLAVRAARPAWATDSDGPETEPALRQAIEALEPYFTRPEDFNDVSRGKPVPHSLPEDRKREVGLTRDTWQLQVMSDPEYPATLGNPLTQATGSALDFASLMKLAETRAVRYAKVMTCLNIGCPLGNGIWEGVPLRDVLWLAEPQENLRRVIYYGYHNDQASQMFRSSLPVGRVLEDLYDLPPVLLCYKLNGQWLSSERGGPVRMLVPEAYGFKSIKWLTHVLLSNMPHANDTYGEKNNDIDSPLKSFAATLSIPTQLDASHTLAVTGYAQVGISGLSKVQVWLQHESEPMPTDTRYFSDATWQDARILPPPADWGGDLPEQRIPPGTLGFDEQGRPLQWPMRLTKAYWAFACSGLKPGKYTFRSRAVDQHGIAQPLPRPFKKSGHAQIESKSFIVS